jgi:hypothetical protein
MTTTTKTTTTRTTARRTRAWTQTVETAKRTQVQSCLNNKTVAVRVRVRGFDQDIDCTFCGDTVVCAREHFAAEERTGARRRACLPAAATSCSEQPLLHVLCFATARVHGVHARCRRCDCANLRFRVRDASVLSRPCKAALFVLFCCICNGCRTCLCTASILWRRLLVSLLVQFINGELAN